jgi:hypothetical protein
LFLVGGGESILDDFRELASGGCAGPYQREKGDGGCSCGVEDVDAIGMSVAVCRSNRITYSSRTCRRPRKEILPRPPLK